MTEDERAEVAELERQIAIYADMVSEMRKARRAIKNRARQRKGGKE